jgi:amino acid transporter
LPWLPFYAALLQPNYLLFCLSTAGILAGLVAALQTMIRAFGRMVYALAKDGFLVDLARYVHAGNRNPLVAHLIFTIVAQVGVSLAANLGVVKILHSTLFAMVCTQLFPALAAVFHPLAKRGWNQRGESSGGKVNSALLVFFGFLAVVIFGWTIAVSLLYPAQGAAIGTTDFIVLGIGFVIGLVLYFWQAILSRRRGMDLLKPYPHFPDD